VIFWPFETKRYGGCRARQELPDECLNCSSDNWSAEIWAPQNRQNPTLRYDPSKMANYKISQNDPFLRVIGNSDHQNRFKTSKNG